MDGLYRGQVIESDDCFHDMETAEGSEVKAVKWSEQIGCSASEDVASCLRKKPVDEIIAAGGRWFPQVDANGLLAEYGIDGIASGKFLKIPTIIGSNREEGRNAGPSYFKFTEADYLKWVEQIGAPDRAKRILEKYPANRHADKAHPIAEVVTDLITDSGMRGLGGCTACW
jgi:para-nitrobenzyl esterase